MFSTASAGTGGKGARIVGCLPNCRSDRLGKPQAIPTPAPGTGLIRANWPATDVYQFPPGAVSGFFLAKLLLTSGKYKGEVTYVPVILREPPSHHSAILVQAPVNTMEAYNGWGGKSLYYGTDGVPANHVSFDRPYDPSRPVPIQFSIGLVRFLERQGYDVSYTTDVDTDRSPRELVRHALVISDGHDEYWTKEMRDAFESARDTGTNLAFIGADIADWQIRYEDGRRTIVEYRDATADPSPDQTTKATRFRWLDQPRPECELIGVSYAGLAGAHDLPRAFSLAPGALKNVWFKGTGFTATSVLPDSVGYEWDAVEAGCDVPPLTVLFRYAGRAADGSPTDAEVVTYRAPSGARVFSAGSLQFVWGLDNFYSRPGLSSNPRLQRFMTNVLNDLGASRLSPIDPAHRHARPSAVGSVPGAPP